MHRRFALHGSDQFNEWMESTTRDIVSDVKTAMGGNLVCLIISGGYARGEGGVIIREGKELPYNDLDFTIVVNDKSEDIPGKLLPISRKYETILGIDVDFSRPLSVEDVRNWPHWLMWTDLVTGSRIVFGEGDFLRKNAPGKLRECPPLIEATRLLLNRGAGLLWSLRILRGIEKSHDPDFVRRNMHKAILAIGDALIIKHGRHQAAYAGRDAILAEIPEGHGVLDLYRQALSFRLTPDNLPEGPSCEKELEPTINLWGKQWLLTEGARTGRSFPSAEAYTAWGGRREPDQNNPRKWPRNLARNLPLGRLSLVYPREQLFRRLPLLLANREANDSWKIASRDFLQLWRRFN